MKRLPIATLRAQAAVSLTKHVSGIRPVSLTAGPAIRFRSIIDPGLRTRLEKLFRSKFSKVELIFGRLNRVS